MFMEEIAFMLDFNGVGQGWDEVVGAKEIVDTKPIKNLEKVFFQKKKKEFRKSFDK